jgi:hypothetical protein
MGHIVSSMVAFASDHASLAYALAFLLAVFEAFPVVGAAIPGTATIVALACPGAGGGALGLASDCGAARFQIEDRAYRGASVAVRIAWPLIPGL